MRNTIHVNNLLRLHLSNFLFISLSFFCQAQQEDLLRIINSDVSTELRQQKIDSFLSVNDKKLSPEVLAECYHDIGNKWYHEQWWSSGLDSDIDHAIFYTKRALGIKQNLKNIKQGSLERSTYNLGVFYELKGNIHKAISTHLTLLNNGQDQEILQNTKLDIGRLYVQTGDFYKALEQFDEVIAYYHYPSTQTKINSVENLIDAFIFRANTYSTMDVQKFSKNIRSNLKSADSIFQLSPELDGYFKNQINQLEGNRLLHNKKYRQAIEYHIKVLKDSLNLYPEELARVHNSIAFSQIKLKHHDSAKIQLKRAISKDENYSAPYENLGDLFLEQDNLKEALYNYQKAINWTINKKDEVNFKQTPDIQSLEVATEKIDLLGHIITKANGWLKYYEHENNRDFLDQALKTYRLADKLVDIIRSESTEYQSKLFWREKGASLYTKAVEACYLLDKPEEAYYFMERNKALLLLEDISNEQAKEIAKLPNAIAEREFELKQAIFLSENNFKNFNTNSADTIVALKREVFKNKQTYNAFVDSLAIAFPEYANIKKKVDILPYLDFKTIYVSEDEVALQYILNDEQGYGLLTTEEETVFFKLEDVETLNKEIISLYGQLTDLTTNRDKINTYNNLSHQVFKQLIPERVHKNFKGKRLILVTDYILQQIPFEAFIVSNEIDTYLIEETEISYAYSISYLEAKKQVVNNPEKELFAIAPVQFANLGLPELLFSSAEVTEAKNIFSGEVALNGEATKNKFIDNLDNTKILHLSTHADISEGADPWIAFSDEKMFLNEIYATKNQAEMVILSACNTSVGELKKGEGAMSLARGFFHSGAKSVVSSLWSTNDKSSKELMISFYKGLDKGMTKSAAMRMAKVDYINKYRGTTVSPSFWAALIVIGDNSPISTFGFANANWGLILVGLVLISALGFFLFRRTKNYSNS